MSASAASPAVAARENEVEAAICASAAAAERRAEPYPNWRFRRVFPERVARELAELPFAPIELSGVSGRRELHNAERQYFAGQVLQDYPVARAVAEAFQSPAVIEALSRTTGARLDGTFLRIEYALDVDGFWLEPHTDLGVKSFTLLYQLAGPGQEDLGTDIYKAADGWVERAPFDWNGALVFVPSDRTFHGFEARKIQGVRRSVIVNYVTDEWRAREQLAFGERPIRA